MSSKIEFQLQHIPSEAYAAVAPRWAIWNPCVGSINKENVTPQESEEDMMGLLEKRPSVKAIFVGHDHGLDWFCPYKNLWLCYVMLTGYGGYGNCASRTHLASNLGY
ncbi:hypothetical protein MLD38_004467 [Melastoma candidum]|uniref:Uncharacterized protein n=1 Tax=Melastoma candidum TaxID=119954 RepID=A0ACB9S6L3_9MYRT|nr:hypothetical protein MLD38_004467 [Melastoma candidum]